MSYSFEVIKDAEGLRVVEPHSSVLAHIPNGKFTVNGHVPGPGMSTVSGIGISLTDQTGKYVAGVSGNHETALK